MDRVVQLAVLCSHGNAGPELRRVLAADAIDPLITPVQSIAGFARVLDTQSFDAVVVNAGSTDIVFEALEVLRAAGRQTPLIAWMDMCAPEALSACFHRGVTDVLVGAQVSRMGHVLQREVLRYRAKSSLDARAEVADATTALLDAVYAHGSDAIVLTCAAGLIRSFSPAAERIYGYSAREVLGQSVELLFLQGQPMETSADAVFDGRQQGMRRDGSIVPVHVVSTPLRSNAGALATRAMLIRDMTAHEQAMQAVERQLHFDAVTGLPNRAHFLQLVDTALMQSDAEQAVCAVLTVNQFDLVNDTLGYAGGEELVMCVSERLSNLRDRGALLGHLGGDAFGVLLTDARDGTGIEAAERLMELFELPFELESYDVHVDVRVGLARFPAHGSEAECLIKNAEAALSAVRDRSGSVHQVYSDAIGIARDRRFERIAALRRAIDQEEFELYYQPIVAARTRRIVGAEALVRWHTEEHGFVSPGEFIPLAEETGLIVKLGAWVVREACRQNAAWQAQGLPRIPIAVNVSGHQLVDSAFLNTLMDALADTGLDPAYLKVELTESTLMRDVTGIMDLLHELSHMRVRIAIDDFGTGYSSLSYLQRLPVDDLKVDRSFVREMATKPADAGLVHAIIAMAHRLGLKVIAEGVETEEQMIYLKAYECDDVQGYLLARPMPAHLFAKRLATDAEEGATPEAKLRIA